MAQHQQPQLVKVDTAGTILWSNTYDTATYGAYITGVKEVQPGGDLDRLWHQRTITPLIDGFLLLLRTNSQGIACG
ncbi:MAG: hypothetical protein H6596_00400 [Flavobacteriales bacterium]|nr:hypothetical protein [Flavobacteriales bacterium]